MLRRLIGENIEVVTAYGSGLARVKADPGQLEQVILNLVVNARDAMPGGGTLSIETANVAVTADEAARHGAEVEPGSFVTLTIRDTGRGMDAETKARLFEPFFTTKGVGKGTGLGLATVYGIVKQSGGFIDVESELGEGASFDDLPARGDRGGRGAGRDAGAARRSLRRGGAESILLVEDEDMVRRYVATVLRGAGYRVLVADGGPEAIEVARQEQVDLLLTDVVMPKISGPELAERLDLPVLFMSGYTGDLIEQHELLQPGTAYIQKPFSADDLRARCARRSTRREHATRALVLVVLEPPGADDSPQEPEPEQAAEQEADEREDVDAEDLRPLVGEDADQARADQAADDDERDRRAGSAPRRAAP